MIVDLGNGVRTIYRYAFGSCTKLESITIPKSVQTLSRSYAGAFESSGLVTVTFESGIVAIPDYGFEQCKKLKNVVIPGKEIVKWKPY